MPFATFIRSLAPPLPREATVRVGERDVPVVFVRNLRARRYVLRLRPDGSARVTVPRGGTNGHALEFARRQTGWIALQLAKPRPSAAPTAWQHGTEI